jgi:hypothetical protein
MLGGKGKGGRVGQRESPSGTEVSPCLRVANLQKIFFLSALECWCACAACACTFEDDRTPNDAETHIRRGESEEERWSRLRSRGGEEHSGWRLLRLTTA